MAENDGVFEDDWDADYLEQLMQVEEHALTSTNPTQLPIPQPPQPPPPRTSISASFRPPTVSHSLSASSSTVNNISYSPPIELSQRPSNFNRHSSVNAQEIEIQRLKRELQRVSNQVNGLEEA